MGIKLAVISGWVGCILSFMCVCVCVCVCVCARACVHVWEWVSGEGVCI